MHQEPSDLWLHCQRLQAWEVEAAAAESEAEESIST